MYVVEYISGYVVKSVGIRQSCNTCFKFVLKRSNDKDTKNNLINFKEKYCLHHPQKEIVAACKFAEAELKSSLNLENCIKKLYFGKTTQKVVNHFTFRHPNLFNAMYVLPGHDPEHHYYLLVNIVKKYLAIRIHKYITKHNVETRQKVRQKLTKLLHFKNK